MQTLVWLWVPDGLVFAVGTLFLAWFAVRLLTGGKRQQRSPVPVADAKRV